MEATRITSSAYIDPIITTAPDKSIMKGMSSRETSPKTLHTRMNWQKPSIAKPSSSNNKNDLTEEAEEFERRMIMHAINMHDQRNSKTPDNLRLAKLRRAAASDTFEKVVAGLESSNPMVQTCTRRLNHSGGGQTADLISFKNNEDNKNDVKQRSYLRIDEDAKLEEAHSSHESWGNRLNINLSNN